jgi:hypothetical protein
MSTAPDPYLAADANQFIRIVLLDHIETCSEDDCESDTRIAVETSEPGGQALPYCPAHAHVVFADWMVRV